MVPLVYQQLCIAFYRYNPERPEVALVGTYAPTAPERISILWRPGHFEVLIPAAFSPSQFVE